MASGPGSDHHAALRTRFVKAYQFTIIGVVGTTIAPWMQFYLQSSVVDKGNLHSPVRRLAAGCDCGLLLHGFGGVVHYRGLRGDAVHAWNAQYSGGVGCGGRHEAAGGGLCIHSVCGWIIQCFHLSASILPLSTAYTVCEGMGFESGLDKSFKEAPFFYWFYTSLIVLGAGVVLWPNFPFVKMIILSQVFNGLLLPVVMIFMLKLINKHDLMGEYVNTRLFNVVAWLTTVVMIGLTMAFGSGR